VRYSRVELQGILAARRGHAETVGNDAWIDLRIKVTPELLEGMLGGTWVAADGSRSTFQGVHIGADGYAEPILVAEVPA
jgi:hypothetical protein